MPSTVKKDISQTKFFQNLLTFLFIAGVVAGFLILGTGYELLLNRLNEDNSLTIILPYYSIVVICLTAFAGVAFILIWRHNVIEVEKNEIIKKYNADYLGTIDTGMLWLAAAMLGWEIISVINLFRYLFDVENQYISVNGYLLLSEIISTLNSAFFILGFSTFKFSQRPTWHQNKLIETFRGENKYRNIIILSLVIISLSSFLLFFSPFWKDFPDLTMSIFTTVLLFLYFKEIFEDRKIRLLRWLLYTTLLLTMMAQIIEPLELFLPYLSENPYFVFISYFVNMTYKFFLTILFFALAYSYRGFLEKRAREKQNTELVLASQELAKVSSEKERLRREMNHTIRGNLDFLSEKLRMLERTSSASTDDQLLITELKSTLKIVGHLHNRLHEDKEAYYPYLSNFLMDFKGDLQELFDIHPDNYSYTIDIKKDFQTRAKHARNIASILVELSLNAFKVYLKNGFAPSSRYLNIEVKEDAENDFLVLSVADKGPGFPENTTWNFGLKTLHEVIEKDLSGIIRRDAHYQNGTKWLIYIPFDKIVKNRNEVL
jgi:two-component sensor histidine kinase